MHPSSQDKKISGMNYGFNFSKNMEAAQTNGVIYSGFWLPNCGHTPQPLVDFATNLTLSD
jgi:hypothetical protein